MCLLALALGVHARFPIVVAANRDEFYARPTEPLGWWSPAADAPLVLSGRDLEAGGTWMGLTAAGRLAMLTNIRAPSQQDPDAESRGRIVTDWLTGSEDPETFWTHVESRRHNGFNLIAADASTGRWFWAAEPRHRAGSARAGHPWPVECRARHAVEEGGRPEAAPS